MKKILTIISLLISVLSFPGIAQTKSCDLSKMKWVGMPFDKAGVFHEECRPQILYSWIDSVHRINQSDSLWPFRRTKAIFFHRTPLATSFYGDFSYRVKLKENVRYKLVPWNEAHYKCLYPEEEKKNTVYVNQDPNGFSEYVLCSSGPVESWSFGIEEHLNEMKREYSLIKEKGPLNVDGFLNPNSRKYGCSSCFQGYTIHDARNDGSERTILNSMERMNSFVETKEGRVYNLVDKQTYRSGEKVEEHFETRLVLPFHKN